MRKFLAWCKNEIVLCIAIGLAVISSFVVTPDQAYLDYIDFRTLAILFCLMAVMAGLQRIGLFQWIAEKLLLKVDTIKGLILILVSLCFVSSMLITNDVALITFVPFTFIVLRLILGDASSKLVVPVVVMQTIAANLGSMLTPIGNPQNLYLYGKSGIELLAFLRLMLPYTVVSFAVLVLWIAAFPYKGEKKLHLELPERTDITPFQKQIVLYVLLFLLCILTVAHMIPCVITLGIVFFVVAIMDRKALKDVDYALLVTFVGFFVFIGNMGRIPAFSQLLEHVIEGNEVIVSVLSSQCMSNVPAALLLSGFTQQYEKLIVGTNLGGLGTLIASMASLISFKYIGKEYGEWKGKYLLLFTVANVIFLAILFVVVWVQ